MPCGSPAAYCTPRAKRPGAVPGTCPTAQKRVAMAGYTAAEKSPAPAAERGSGDASRNERQMYKGNRPRLFPS